MGSDRRSPRPSAGGSASSWALGIGVGSIVALAVGFLVIGPALSVSSSGGPSSAGQLASLANRFRSGGRASLSTGGSGAAKPQAGPSVPLTEDDAVPSAPSCPPVPEALVESVMSTGSAVDEGGPKLWAEGMPDVVDELPPLIKPSLFARVYGKEPYQLESTNAWELHTIPTNEWVDRAAEKIERCPLDKLWPGSESLSNEITWVSLLLDLKRGEGGNKQFQRSMSEYYSRFQRIIDRGFKMVIFIPKEFEQHLKLDKSRIKVVHFTVDDLKKYFPYFDRVDSVRTSPHYVKQSKAAGWLENAPQARLPMYDPLVMSKLNLLRDVARWNPWQTKRLMFMDAGHFCATELKPGKMPVFDRHMDKFFLTHWPYGTATEVHGMTDKAMHLYMGAEQDPMRIVRGGVFGGERAYIECVAKAYNRALAQTLRDGYLGTEENIFAMIFERFPALFHGFDNNSLGNHGDNCAAFAKNQLEVRQGKS
ncbi:hypothetical protein FNF27_07963 [Cafeteria roenbergensis]|uniref:Uncharacterized protein n=1 Tax=Cafeteria roenbergensis TaxID=33653 RepID=A0A5A8DDG9_CAFRO|nr:hypothetical protein FNF27_07963 [Cafeteria roenbergensis]